MSDTALETSATKTKPQEPIRHLYPFNPPVPLGAVALCGVVKRTTGQGTSKGPACVVCQEMFKTFDMG